MPVDDTSIFTEIPVPPQEKKLLVPSTTRVIVYTTAMEEGRPARFTENTVGGASPFSDDVTETYKQVTSVHLYKMSKEGQNKYSVALGSIPGTQKLPGGFTAPLTINPVAVERKFLDTYEQSSSPDAKNAVNSFNEEPNYIGVKIQKGKEFPGSGTDIEKIYSEIKPNGNDSSGQAVDAAAKLLSENNLYDPGNVYVKESSDYIEKKETTTVGQLIVQPELGSHSPRKYPNAKDTNISNDKLNAIHIEKMKTFALQMLMESSGENYVPNNDKDDISNFAESVYSELKDKFYSSDSPSPGASRLGLKIPVNRFSQTEIIDNINPNFTKPSKKTNIKTNTDDNVFSYGNVNSYLAPFDSLDSTVSNVAAALLVSIIASVVDNISTNVGSDFRIRTENEYHRAVMRGLEIFFDIDAQEVIDHSTDGNTTSGGDGFTTRRSSGGSSASGFTTSRASATSTSFSMRAGFITRRPSAVISRTPPNISEISRIRQSPEYYNVIMRVLIREFNKEILSGISNPFFSVNVSNVTNQVQRAAGSGQVQSPDTTNLTGLDYNPKIGISSDVTNNYKAFLNLKNSKLIGFLNSLARIGDISLTREQIIPGLQQSGGSSSRDVYSYTLDSQIVDTFGTATEPEINPAALIYKTYLSREASRKIGGRKVQAIANNSTPSKFILPESLLLSETRINGNSSRINRYSSNGQFVRSTSSRLSIETVQEIEKKLDSSYVPFYMHDLRTNEIVSFHAFLESLSDTYSPSYSSTDGYGRVEAVQTYSNTKREISFDFTIVAVNSTDFDEMWWKINKLTTLVYPQYTQGRALKVSEGQKFIQPFSQLPASSPMIRLRIGDVIKSNFSGFNLARMFGIGETGEVFQINNQAATEAQAQIEERLRRKGEITSRIRARMTSGDLNISRFNAGERFEVNLDFSRRRGDSVQSFALIPGSGESLSQRLARQGRIFRSIPAGFHVLEVIDNNIINDLSDDEASQYREREALARTYKVRFKNPLPGFVQANDEFYFIDIANEIRLIESEIDRLSERELGPPPPPTTSTTSSLQNTQEFLSVEQNPIFKSFQSVKGKGLAGFVTSLNFDWINDNTIWETDGLNNRAPKLCKVKVIFAPIHDIAPGIDSNGFNRAPIYSVGNLGAATTFDLPNVTEDNEDYRNRVNAVRMFKGT